MRRPRHPRRESNLAKRLMARQMGTRAIAFTTNAHADKFRNMRCQVRSFSRKTNQTF